MQSGPLGVGRCSQSRSGQRGGEKPPTGWKVGGARNPSIPDRKEPIMLPRGQSWGEKSNGIEHGPDDCSLDSSVGKGRLKQRATSSLLPQLSVRSGGAAVEGCPIMVSLDLLMSVTVQSAAPLHLQAIHGTSLCQAPCRPGGMRTRSPESPKSTPVLFVWANGHGPRSILHLS